MFYERLLPGDELKLPNFLMKTYRTKLRSIHESENFLTMKLFKFLFKGGGEGGTRQREALSFTIKI